MGSVPVAVTAVVAAAGSGQRLGAGGPKAFVPLAGRPMVEWSVAAFAAADSVGAVIVACPPGYRRNGEAEDGVGGGDGPASPGGWGALGGENLTVVEGGETRAQSVANALEAVGTELVTIHDAARPLVTPELIEGVIATLRADDGAAGAIAATPVTDTIKQVGWVDGPTDATNCQFGPYMGHKRQFAVEGTLDRGRLWAAQTPQVFRTEALRGAIDAAGDAAAATDEAMLVEKAGGRVLIHPAPPENLKVTTPADLRLAELFLAERSGPPGPRSAR